VDTRPSQRVIDLATEADLLIHDGMFADAMVTEAGERGHSTARQAAEVAEQAQAKQLILTHISPRYEEDTPLIDEARSIFPRTNIARDLMTVEIPVHK